MGKENTVSLVMDIVEPIAKELSLKIWDVVFEKEGINWFLRVFIEREDNESVSTDDCEHLSKPLSIKLDELDPIDKSYYLEVSSPGLGRRLRNKKQLNDKIGEEIMFKLIRPKNGQREFQGILKSVEDNYISVDGINFNVIIKECSYIKLNDDKNLFD